MKISILIEKLNSALEEYGDIDVTVSETLWMYNSIKSVKYVERPYSDSSDSVVELTDTEISPDDEYYKIL